MNYPYFIKILIILISTAFASCGTTHYHVFGRFSKKDAYRVNSYYGCCGCEAKYFIIYAKRKPIEQVVYYYNCSNSTIKPTKFVFKYNKWGKRISCDKYVATTENNFIIELNQQEKFIFSTLETDSLTRPPEKAIDFLTIKGFRKPLNEDATHPFPLVKKGYKLPIN